MELAPKPVAREHPNKGKKWGKPFQKGHSGNKSGRPKDAQGAADLARSYSLEAVRVLAQTMRDKRVSPGVRVACAERLLDRGLGKPLQTAIKATVDLRDAAMLTDNELAAIALGREIDTLDVTPSSSSSSSSEQDQ